jgi:muramoyltetrapeptide carboxypeptidase LdcA involved in peptidoglycan recycling
MTVDMQLHIATLLPSITGILAPLGGADCKQVLTDAAFGRLMDGL